MDLSLQKHGGNFLPDFASESEFNFLDPPTPEITPKPSVIDGEMRSQMAEVLKNPSRNTSNKHIS